MQVGVRLVETPPLQSSIGAWLKVTLHGGSPAVGQKPRRQVVFFQRLRRRMGNAKAQETECSWVFAKPELWSCRGPGWMHMKVWRSTIP